jgi:hypothetical protein
MFAALTRWASRVGLIVLAGYLAWQVRDVVLPAKPEVSRGRQEVANQLVPLIVEDLRKSRGDLRSAALLPLSGDASGYVSEQLRQVIGASGILDLGDRTISERVRDALHLRQATCENATEAAVEARSRGAPAAIWGVVQTFESSPHGAVLDVEIHLLDVQSGKDVSSRRYTRDLDNTPLMQTLADVKASGPRILERIAAWLIAALLLPVFTIEFLRATVRKESNRWNGTALAIYTVADALLAVLLGGGGLSTPALVALILAAAVVGFTYNVVIMTRVVKAEVEP